MSNEFNELDALLGSASRDLRTQIGDTDIPEFRPPNNNVRTVVVAALLLVAGIVGVSVLRGETPNEIDTVDAPENGNVQEVPDITSQEPNQDGPATTPNPSADELITGFDTTPPVESLAPTALGEFWNDPAYRSVQRRVTDDASRPEVSARTGSAFASPENADGSAVLVLRDETFWHIVDRATLESTAIDSVSTRSEPHWHPTDATRIRHLAESDAANRLVLLETSIGGATVTLADLADPITELFPTAAVITSGGGHDPVAGNIYAWAVLDQSGELIGAVSYDLDQGTVLGSTPAPDEDFGDFSSVRVSPSGTHVILGFVDNTISYDITLGDPRVLDQRDRSGALVAMPGSADVLLTVSLTSDTANGGWIYWLDLETGESTRLFDLFDNANTSVSFSATPGRPGWAVMSTFGCNVDGAWSCDKVFAVDLASGTLVNLAHTYSCAPVGIAPPQASVSPRLDRVYFSSDSCAGTTNVVELTAPPDLFSLAGE